MKLLIIKLYKKCEKLFKYLFFSVLSTILDTAVVWITFHLLNLELVISNTAWVVTGFFLSYFLSLKTVFDTRQGIGAFAVYGGTSLIGLVLANYLITTVYTFSVGYCPEWFAFLLSKGVSIVLPFFVMYFMRKYLYIWLNKRRKSHE